MYQIISYISRVSKEPIYVKGKLFTEDVVETVKLTNRFFVRDTCYMCGKCCSNYNVCYTKSQFESILFAQEKEFLDKGLDYSRKLELVAGVKVRKLEINGKRVEFYSFPKTNKKNHNIIHFEDRTNDKYCHFLEKRGTNNYVCSIHPIRSITCKIPHMRFIYRANTKTTSLSVGTYPRNFNLHCPVKFPPELDEPSVLMRIEDLKILNKCSDDLGINTFLPEIIDYLENGGRRPREFTYNKKNGRKLFNFKT